MASRAIGRHVRIGASDNATGVATVLAVTRDATTVKARTRDLLVVFFDEEERGLVGARQFAERLKTQGARVHSVHTIDQVGWDKNGNGAIELELPYTTPPRMPPRHELEIPGRRERRRDC